MKRLFIVFTMLLISLLYSTGCSVVEGRPEKDNINQARGSYVWWDTRQNYEFDASQLNDEFGDQPGDENYERQNALNTDAQNFKF